MRNIARLSAARLDDTVVIYSKKDQYKPLAVAYIEQTFRIFSRLATGEVVFDKYGLDRTRTYNPMTYQHTPLPERLDKRVL